MDPLRAAAAKKLDELELGNANKNWQHRSQYAPVPQSPSTRKKKTQLKKKNQLPETEQRHCVGVICGIALFTSLILLLVTVEQEAVVKGRHGNVNSTTINMKPGHSTRFSNGNGYVPPSSTVSEPELMPDTSVFTLDTAIPECPSTFSTSTPQCSNDWIWQISSGVNSGKVLRNVAGKPVSFGFAANVSAEPRTTIRGHGTLVLGNTAPGEPPLWVALRLAHVIAVVETQEIDPQTGSRWWKHLHTAVAHGEAADEIAFGSECESSANCGDGRLSAIEACTESSKPWCQDVDTASNHARLDIATRKLQPVTNSLLAKGITLPTETCAGAASVSFNYEFGPIDPLYVNVRGGFRVRVLATVVDARGPIALEKIDETEWKASCPVPSATNECSNATVLRAQTVTMKHEAFDEKFGDCEERCGEVTVVSDGLVTDEDACIQITTLNNGADRFAKLIKNTTFDVEGSVSCFTGPKAKFCQATIRDTTRANGCEVEYAQAESIHVSCN